VSPAVNSIPTSTPEVALDLIFAPAMYRDAFEELVAGILHRIVAKSPHLRLIVGEPEMHSASQKQKGQTPPVCDWMILGEALHRHRRHEPCRQS
jgi:hypothetical protein